MSVGAKLNARDSIGVRIIVLNGVLALAEGVPELDGAVR